MIKKGKYRHYKGKDYEVIGLGKDEATMNDVVIYKPLYENEFGPDMLWIRTVDVFCEEVLVDGKKVPRFTRVESENN